eukprot:gnl/Dysnectes_brevis/1964_a2258_1220.p1 GENE.gnl/Dysnectes_brevis/1964_a2258_1220~~gnl/Dysnectes_brevis/1964_a2258_1220.p1  ORF type:complete len:337 (+),score=126.04 gnl/Dysnectes_brevis/1964_a2258_1220:1314-2324(+)
MMQRSTLISLILAVIAAILYSLNSEIMQTEVTHDVGAFFTIWFVHAFEVICLPIGLLCWPKDSFHALEKGWKGGQSDLSESSSFLDPKKNTRPKALQYLVPCVILSAVYLLQNVTYTAALSYVSVTLDTALTNLVPVTTLILQPWIGQRIRTPQTLAALAATAGVLFLSFAPTVDVTRTLLTSADIWIGVTLCMVSLVSGTLYKVLYTRWYGYTDTGFVVRFLGWLGLAHLVLFWPLFPILDWLGIEAFSIPAWDAIKVLLENAGIGLVVNACLMVILGISGPLLQAVASVLCLPSAVLMDLAAGRVGYTSGGAWMVVGGTLLMVGGLGVLTMKKQ